MPTAEDFRKALEIIFKYKTLCEQSSYVEIKSSDLHKIVGGYPSVDGNHRMKTCCEVMYSMKQNKDVVIDAPNKGFGASLKIKYTLPR